MINLQHINPSCKRVSLNPCIQLFFAPMQTGAKTFLLLIFLGTFIGCFTLLPVQAALHRYKVSGVMPTYGTVPLGLAQISPDGKYVVYVADQQTDGAFELYTAPADVSSAPVRISPALTVTVSITNFSISPDSTRVVYRADQETNGSYELYGVYDDSYSKSFLLFMPAILSGHINKQ